MRRILRLKLLKPQFLIFTTLVCLAAAFAAANGPASASFQLSDGADLSSANLMPEGGYPVESVIVSADVLDASPLMPLNLNRDTLEQVDDLDQGEEGCTKTGGILRYEAQTFPGPAFPKRGEDWSVADLHGPRPGFIDEVMWGLADCDPAEGKYSLWSMGGGSIGKSLNCSSKDYYTEARDKGGINTILRFGQIKLSGKENIRIAFDYKAKMPPKGLFVGLADASVRDDDPTASLNFRGYDYFEADTNDEWVRGHPVNYLSGAPEFDDLVSQFASKEKIEIGIFYRDPAPSPELGPPTAGMYGVFLDSILIDVKSIRRPCLIGSPTSIVPTEIPATPTPDTPPTSLTPTATNIPVVIPTVPPTRVPEPNFMPLLIKGYTQPGKPTAIPTVPSDTPPPTDTPSATPTPSLTPTQTRTPIPTNTYTPTPTPVPTDPPPPYPQLQISWVQPFTPGDEFEYVEIYNGGTGPQLMDWWEIAALKSANRCSFREGLVIGPGEVYEIRGGKDATNGIRQTDDGPVDGEICEHRNGPNMFLDNNNDIVHLSDDIRTIIDKYCWNLQGPYPCFNNPPPP